MNIEDCEQIAFIDRCQWHYILRDHVWHNINQGKRSRTYGRKLVRMGLKKGVADITIAYPVPPYHGMFMEFKSQDGRLSKEQVEFLTNMAKVGYATYVPYSADEAWAVTMQYLDGKFEQGIRYDIV